MHYIVIFTHYSWFLELFVHVYSAKHLREGFMHCLLSDLAIALKALPVVTAI